MRLFDSHIHLDEIEDAELPDVEAYRALVPGIVPEVTRERLDGLVAAGHRPAMALHPWYLESNEPEGERWARHAEATADPRVVAVGETGLDRFKHRDADARQRAARWFAAHVRLAADLHKPLVVHCVRAHGECLEILRAVRPPAGGVIHAFSGSAEVMQAYDALGFRVGIGAAVTRSRSTRVRAAAVAVPEHQLLVETDAPYMAVDDNEDGQPRDLLRVVQVIAELRGVSVEEIARRTWENAEILFGQAPPG
jgi:TatD DNase family protein